jgi:hypothetical protein
MFFLHHRCVALLYFLFSIERFTNSKFQILKSFHDLKVVAIQNIHQFYNSSLTIHDLRAVAFPSPLVERGWGEVIFSFTIHYKCALCFSTNYVQLYPNDVPEAM